MTAMNESWRSARLVSRVACSPGAGARGRWHKVVRAEWAKEFAAWFAHSGRLVATESPSGVMCGPGLRRLYQAMPPGTSGCLTRSKHGAQRQERSEAHHLLEPACHIVRLAARLCA